MKNVYDIREEKNLFWIFPKNDGSYKAFEEKACVVIYMYYIETIDYFMEYILNLRNSVDIVIISSKQEVLDSAEKIFKENKINRVQYRLKKNRGRDISAFLVAGADFFEKYDYLCFIHDKKEKSEFNKKSTFEWVDIGWSSMIASDSFVMHIMEVFRDNPNVGLILPPEPDTLVNKGMNWHANRWHDNFDNAVKLAKELGLKADLNHEKSPMAFGTFFWCRTAALKKLIDRGWDYDDFPDEPLAEDGTISHTIERILPYVAQDAGYDTGTVFTSEHVSELLGILLGGIREAFRITGEYVGVTNYNEAERFGRQMTPVKKYLDEHSRVFIYGAGIVADRCFKFLKFCDKEFDGYIVSEIATKELNGKKVYTVDEFQRKDGDGIIIGVSKRYVDEIKKKLKEKGIDDYLVFVDL